MTPRPLRGVRYAEAASPSLVEIIQFELPYFDFLQAGRFYADLLSSRRTTDADLALLGCNDRYFLLTGLLNRPDAIHPWIFDRCRELDARPDGFLDLWARGHYKSTAGTFTGSIQDALDDPDAVTIGIFSNTKDISRPFLAQIKEELENNDYLKSIYHDALWTNPRKEAPSWSVQGGLVLKRKSNPKECTFEAHGLIDAMPTGRHFSHLYFDDVINEKNVGNPDQIKKATERFELADNLGPTHGIAKKRVYGTRYSFADSYGVFIERGILIPRIYPATDDGTLTGKPVLLTEEAWEEKKKTQRSTLAAQMLQNPLAGDENMFKAEWLRPYFVRPAMMHVYIMADPSLGRHKTSDRTAMAVVGVDTTGNKYLLDGYCHRMALSEKWTNLYGLYRKWNNMPGVQLLQVGYERYGMQADLEYFEERMREDKTQRFHIEELNWTQNRGLETKAHRVARLEPDFRLERFFVPGLVHYANAPIDPDKRKAIADGKIEKPKDPNVATWHLNAEGQIAYRVYLGAKALEREMLESHEMRRSDEDGEVYRTGQTWRIVQPLRRIDEDKQIYDLTRVFFEEFLFFPFSPRDDLIDATSRVYDMKPTSASAFEEEPDRVYHPDD